LDVDEFLFTRIDKKLVYLSSFRLNAVDRAIIANSVLISSMMYFLVLWGGTKAGVGWQEPPVRFKISYGQDLLHKPGPVSLGKPAIFSEKMEG
jgi:hypothetical protein